MLAQEELTEALAPVELVEELAETLVPVELALASEQVPAEQESVEEVLNSVLDLDSDSVLYLNLD